MIGKFSADPSGLRVRADFDWRVHGDLVKIVDLNLGNMSVTNDLENVLAALVGELPNPITQFRFIYRDTMGEWDHIRVRDHEVLAHTFEFEVVAGPRDPDELEKLLGGEK